MSKQDKTGREITAEPRKTDVKKPADAIEARRPLGTTDWAILYAGE